MKINKIMLPFIICSLALSSCDDQIMSWKDKDSGVDSSDIPLALKEKLANYKNIKEYAQEYTPNMTIGLGLGVDLYLSNPYYKLIADENFQLYTPGNAMKNASVVTNSGNMNFEKIDEFLAAVPEDIEIYGHNFIWHTQQKQAYLKTLIAPTLNTESSGDLTNILSSDASSFNNNSIGGWGSWGSNKDKVEISENGGPDGSGCLVLANKGDGNSWEAQLAYTFDEYLQPSKTYMIKFKAKSTSAAGQLQFQYQNGTTYGSQGGYNTFNIGTNWSDFEYEFTVKPEDVNRILINFGAVGATYYIDDIEFGPKVEETMNNVLTGDDSNFEGGTLGKWGSWGSNKDDAKAEAGAGYDGTFGAMLKNKGDGNAWEAQFAYTFDEYLVKGTVYQIQFDAKSTSGAGQIQFQYQNGSTYGSQGGYNTFNIGTDWTKCKYEFTASFEDINRIIMNFGAVGATYYIDNIKFGIKKDNASRSVRLRAAKAKYTLMSADKKKEALLNEMERWIKGMLTHEGMERIKSWDVINEPISDNNKWRGIDNVFGGKDDDGNEDSAPTEDEENGLSLNWASDHFYWGYYIGKEYASKAFEYARKYAPEGTKLFVNDYNLETNSNKLNALIDFVKYIDENNETGKAIVDGIGTQMHVSPSKITRDQVDTMFKTLAATGKLIRVTELDVALGTATPSAAQMESQSDTYQMIIESYKENIPQAQQSGITIWGLSDSADEHEYWLNGDTPNLFNNNYERKHAYKGVCDGIAGKDLSEDFSGNDWKNAQ